MESVASVKNVPEQPGVLHCCWHLGMSFAEARQVGMLSLSGTGPMPRVMCFPVPKGENWHNLYDYIRCVSSMSV